MTNFSFIVPVYNVEKYICQCVDSILNQTYQNYEIILIDDGSSDNSGYICDEYKNKDKRIKVLHTKNRGLSEARNKGIEISKGKYIIFLDSDDYWFPDKLETIAGTCEAYKVDVLTFNYEVYDEVKKKIAISKTRNFNGIDKEQVISGQEYLKRVLKNDSLYSWYAWLYVIKRSIMVDFDLRFRPGIKYEDVDLIYKIVLSAKRVYIFNEKVLCYRINRFGAITSNTKLDTELNKLEVIKQNIKYVEKKVIDEELKRLLLNNLSCLYYSTLILYYDINSADRKKLLDELKDSYWVCKHTSNRNQRSIYYLSKIIGLKSVCYLLHLRKCLRETKGS